MTGFVPSRYLSLSDAVKRCAQRWFVDAWRDSEVTPSLAAEVVKALRAPEGAVQFDLVKERARQDNTPAVQESRARGLRRRALEDLAWARLRQHLYSPDVHAVVLSQNDGSLHAVPNGNWATAGMRDFRLITEAEILQDGWLRIRGPVLVAESELHRLLISVNNVPENPVPDDKSVSKKPARGAPKFESAKKALSAMYPHGIPDGPFAFKEHAAKLKISESVLKRAMRDIRAK